MAGATQSFLTMTTPLGAGVLVPTALGAEEAIGAPFLVVVDMVSEQPQIDPNRLLHQPACVTLRREDWPDRNFHGLIRRFVATGQVNDTHWGYRAEIVPQLWFLSQTEDCRIFENKTAEEIITTILGDAGITDYEMRLYGDKPQREYTVQYNETDLAFVTRLMEEEGWYYFFEHAPAKHTLVITDGNTAFQPIPEPSLLFDPGRSQAMDALTLWQPAGATTHGQTMLTDYDPTAPSKNLSATQNTTLQAGAAAKRDAMHWPARSNDPAIVAARTRVRIEAAEAAVSVIEIAGQHDGMRPGGKFTLANKVFGDEAGKEYVVRSVLHQAQEESWVAGGAPTTYRNSATVFPASVTWRQPLATPRPAMAGIYSAVVIGPEGEEIHTDKYGRVKVRLRFDHRNDATADGSIWVRVLQPWADNTWGWQFLPRVGSEVGVAFMDADPDRPIVVGALYNGERMPTFALPAEKTKSGLRTRSTPQGGSANFSEFSIEDKKGEELVFLHAERDHKIEVEHDETHSVDNDRTRKVGQKEKVEIGDTQSVKVQNGYDMTVSTGPWKTVAQADITTQSQTGNIAVKADMGNISTTADLGNISTKASVGAITLEALQSIELKVGMNSIKIDMTGITVNGMMVSLEGQLQTAVKGLMTQVSGSGMLQTQAGITMMS